MNNEKWKKRESKGMKVEIKQLLEPKLRFNKKEQPKTDK